MADSMSVEARTNIETLYKDLWKVVNTTVSMNRDGAVQGVEKRMAQLDSLAEVPLVSAKHATSLPSSPTWLTPCLWRRGRTSRLFTRICGRS